MPEYRLLDIGRNHLTLARAALYAAILGTQPPAGAHRTRLGFPAPRGPRRLHSPSPFYPRPLACADRRLWQARASDLDEAFEIAERGPMRLHLADIHLHRARLFGLIANRPETYPWVSPRDDLDKARKLIDECGYGRRREELEDAEAAWRRLYATPAPRAAT